MKPSDDLFCLIKSLSRSEKGYFRKYASVHVKGEQNTYQKLFDVISNQEHFDEEEMKRQLGQTPLLNYLPTAKHQLYNLVLKTLRAYYEENSIDCQVRDFLQDIEFLYSKALFRQCRKLIQKVKAICTENERLFALLEVCRWEIRVWIGELENSEASFSKLEDVVAHQKEILAKISYLVELENIFNKAYLVLGASGKPRSVSEQAQFLEILQHPLLQDESPLHSLETRFNWYNIKGVEAYVNSDWKAAFTYMTKIVRLFEENPKSISRFPAKYFSALVNRCQMGVFLGRKKDVMQALHKIRQAPVQHTCFRSENYQVKVFLALYGMELHFYQRTGEFGRIMSLVDEVEIILPRYVHKAGVRQLLNFYLRLSIVCFCAGQYKKALHWLNKVHNGRCEVYQHREFVAFVNVYNLLVHYELQNFDLLIYTLRATERRLKSRKLFFRFEQALIEYFKTTLRKNGSDLRSSALKQLAHTLKEIKTDPYESRPLEYFDIALWAESKYRGIPLQKIISQGTKT